MNTARVGFCLVVAAVSGLAPGCDPGDQVVTPQPILDLEQARVEYPTALDVQVNLMTNTCSPNPGVCHQGREYPELHTITSLAEAIGARCNVAPPVPALGWDDCERPPYWVEMGDFRSAIATKEHVGPGQWTFGLAQPIPTGVVPDEPFEEGAAEVFRIVDDQSELVFAPSDDWVTTLVGSPDAMSVTVLVMPKTQAQDLGDLIDTVLAPVVEGDPNNNGIWGGLDVEPDARLIVPGSTARSYLWRRMVGDVPGDRMPIANGPVTNAQMLALGCLIEGLDPEATMDLHALIDYEGCSFAEDPPLLVASEDGSESGTD